MPGGSSAGTATPITALPFSDSGTSPDAAGVWWIYTAPTPVDTNELSIFPYAAALLNQRLRVYSPDAVTPYPPAEAGNFVNSRPLQIPVVAGVSYYLNLYNQAGAYTLSVIAGPNELAPIGSIFVNDDAAGWPLALLSGTDGTVLRFVHPFPAGENADVIASGAQTGRILVHNRAGGSAGGDDHLHLYSSQLDLLVDLPYRTSDGSPYPIRAMPTGPFYVGIPLDPLNSHLSSATTVTTAGAFGPTTWNLSWTFRNQIAASPDETILYALKLSSGAPRIVGRWDLVNDVTLTDLVATVANYFTDDLLVLSDGTIVVAYKRTVSNVAPFIRWFAPDGTILQTVTFTTSHSQDLRLAQALDDPVSFWVWTKADATGGLSGATTLNKFTNLQASDGSVLASFSVPQFNHGGYEGAKSATPLAYFGASESCPFLLLRELYPTIPAITGTLDLTAPSPSTLDVTGYPVPPRHPDAFCGRRS